MKREERMMERMKYMKKGLRILRRILAGLLTGLLVLGIVGLVGYRIITKTDHEVRRNAIVEDAILYTIDGEELEYNVICYGDVSRAYILDSSGNGIDSLEKLAQVLGTADAPAEKFPADPGSSRTIGKAVVADLVTDDKGDIVSVNVRSVTDRPVIGISWKKDGVDREYRGFAEAFERNGAMVVYLPRITDGASAQEVLSRVDGIFVTGGEDWNPGRYGEEASPHGAKDWNDIRDTSDLHLMQQAIALDVPMLCVCRGAQGLNVALGGALIQDVPCHQGVKVLDGTIDESRVTKYISGKDGSGCGCKDAKHLRVQIDGLNHGVMGFYHVLEAGADGIGISRESKWLYEIFGTTSIDLISTSHHQAIDPDRLGEGLTVVAMTSDGVVEAVEYQDNFFALALQWHPEREALSDACLTDVSQELANLPLRALVEHAAIHGSPTAEPQE